jgi:uncharacterized membrane protein
MSALYFGAGIYHLINPDVYVKIMPAWLGWHKQLVLISGLCELSFAILLLIPKTRILASWLIIALLIAIFPANIQMMLNYQEEDNAMIWLTILRLPLQFILIWWAYIFTKKESVS